MAYSRSRFVPRTLTSWRTSGSRREWGRGNRGLGEMEQLLGALDRGARHGRRDSYPTAPGAQHPGDAPGFFLLATAHGPVVHPPVVPDPGGFRMPSGLVRSVACM